MTYAYINGEEKCWKHSYRVHLHEFDVDGLLVNADCEQDALDYAVDHVETSSPGLFMTPEERDEADTRGEEYITAGNHYLALSSSEHVRIDRLD